MKRYILLSLLIASLILAPIFAKAQEESDEGSNTRSYRELRSEGRINLSATASTTIRLRLNEQQKKLREAHEKLEDQRHEMREKASSSREKMEEDREEKREKMREKASTTRAKHEDKREEQREKMLEMRIKTQERRQSIVIKHLENTFRVYNNALDRVEDLSERIDSRIAKFEAGTTTASTSVRADVTLAKTENTLAKIKIIEARTLLLQIKAQASTSISIIGTTTSTTTIKNRVAAINNLFKQARTSIKGAHAQVVKAIVALKGPENDEEDDDDRPRTGTTTPPITSTPSATTTATTTASTTTQ